MKSRLISNFAAESEVNHQGVGSMNCKLWVYEL